jgi:hypothetical protein
MYVASTSGETKMIPSLKSCQIVLVALVLVFATITGRFLYVKDYVTQLINTSGLCNATAFAKNMAHGAARIKYQNTFDQLAADNAFRTVECN